MKKIVVIAQGRFGFLKVASLVAAIDSNTILEPVPVLVVRDGEERLVDELTASVGLSDRFRRIRLEPGTDVSETAGLMLEFEKIFMEVSPDFVVPGGFDNAAVAAAMSASRMGIPVVSLDAGLRTYDRSKTGELNRLVLDSLASLHFVSEHSGVYNLINEGYADDQILFAGNTSIDSLVTMIADANRSGVLAEVGVEPKRFALVMLDMPLQPETSVNRDLLCKVLEAVAGTTTVLMPVEMAAEAGVQEAFGSVPGLRLLPSPGPVALLRLLKEAAFVLTDNDDYESELTVMNVPCLTMRPTTTRPSTIEVGTNVLVGYDEEEIIERASVILSGKPTGKTLIPEKWDGASAKRIAEVLERAG